MSFAGLLLEIGLKGGAVVLFFFAVSLFLRKKSPSWENRLWRICLWGIVISPLWTIANAMSPLGYPVIYGPTSSIHLDTMPVVPKLQIAIEANPAIFTPVFDWDRPIMIVYALGVMCCLAWLVAGLIRVRRIVNRATPFPVHDVLLSDKLAAPATAGALKPVILLPVEAREWDPDSLGAAILHERTHIRRRDWSWQITSQFVRAFFWFNPFVWLSTTALRQSGERACDDKVVQSGYGAAAYAKQLLAIVAHGGPTPDTVVAIARKGGLKSRLKRILAPGYPFRPAG